MLNLFSLIPFIAIPLFILWLVKQHKILDKIGSITLAYLAGVLLANLGFSHPSVLWAQNQVSSLTIPMAIPLLISTINLRIWGTMAQKAVIALLITVFSVVLSVLIFSHFFSKNDAEYWKIAGMMTGLYTGGTPNLAAIKTALDAEESTYILVHTFDMVWTSVYLLFLMTIAKPLYNMVLPHFKAPNHTINEQALETTKTYGLNRQSLKPYAISFLISIVSLAIAGVVSKIVPSTVMMLSVILSITTFGLLLSLFRPIQSLKTSEPLGMFLILIFSFTVATMADFSNFSLHSLWLFLNIGLVIFTSLLIQLILAKIFKIDTDTTIISSTALICSPPFVPLVAGGIKNKTVIFIGIAIGIIGYAIGNYIGISLAYLIR